MPHFLITDRENGSIDRQPVVIPENAQMTLIGELADQDGFQGGKLYVTKGGKFVAVEE